jgi:hypothetical protein
MGHCVHRVIGQCAPGPSGSASERFTAVSGRDYAHGPRSISGTVARGWADSLVAVRWPSCKSFRTLPVRRETLRARAVRPGQSGPFRALWHRIPSVANLSWQCQRGFVVFDACQVLMVRLGGTAAWVRGSMPPTSWICWLTQAHARQASKCASSVVLRLFLSVPNA